MTGEGPDRQSRSTCGQLARTPARRTSFARSFPTGPGGLDACVPRVVRRRPRKRPSRIRRRWRRVTSPTKRSDGLSWASSIHMALVVAGSATHSFIRRPCPGSKCSAPDEAIKALTRSCGSLTTRLPLTLIAKTFAPTFSPDEPNIRASVTAVLPANAATTRAKSGSASAFASPTRRAPFTVFSDCCPRGRRRDRWLDERVFIGAGSVDRGNEHVQ